jgi:hypothetical protein
VIKTGVFIRVVSVVRVEVPELKERAFETLFPLIARSCPGVSEAIVRDVVIVGKGVLVNVGITPSSISIGLEDDELLTASIAAERVPGPLAAELVTDVVANSGCKEKQERETTLKRKERFDKSMKLPLKI